MEAGETLEQALIREASEEVNVAPVTYSAVARIVDPNTTSEPITYHMYAVREWSGQPSIINDEHTELRWFTLEEAQALQDLALEDYRPLFDLCALGPVFEGNHPPSTAAEVTGAAGIVCCPHPQPAFAASTIQELWSRPALLDPSGL